MTGPRLDPITRLRLRRLRRIRRGYYSFLVLLGLTVLSLFSDYIANRRAIVVRYQGDFYFPTFRFHDMATFGQQDEYGFDDLEADYTALRAKFEDAGAGDISIDPGNPNFLFASKYIIFY